jgi:iron complex outermembrane receptor protein
VKFDNRLLQYNPCPTNQQQNPGCGNSFHNAGSVTSKGAELGVLWKPLAWLTWYNSASYSKSTYDENPELVHDHLRDQADGRQAAGGHAKDMMASVLTVKQDGFFGPRCRASTPAVATTPTPTTRASAATPPSTWASATSSARSAS